MFGWGLRLVLTKGSLSAECLEREPLAPLGAPPLQVGGCPALRTPEGPQTLRVWAGEFLALLRTQPFEQGSELMEILGIDYGYSSPHLLRV